MEVKELLGAELYEQVVAKIGEHQVAVVSDGRWFPKRKFDEVNQARRKLESTLKERETEIERLQAIVTDLTDHSSASFERRIGKEMVHWLEGQYMMLLSERKLERELVRYLTRKTWLERTDFEERMMEDAGDDQ